MKKVFAILLLAVMLVSLGACTVNPAATEPAAVQTPTTEPTTTEPPATEATTTEPPATEPPSEWELDGITYRRLEEPYTVPVANPNKDIYETPDGEYLRDFGQIGYFTVIEEAKDADGTTWAKLEDGTGWIKVYQQILPTLDMSFCSGVGAWSTELKLKGNGKFTGVYHDSDMGDMGADYPDGTIYVCDFSGSLYVTDISSYKVCLKLSKLSQTKKEGKTWIEDGVRYIASSPYGMDGGEDFILYTPSTPVSKLPEDVRSWGLAFGIPTSGKLGCYALYCVDGGTVFFSG